MRFQSENTVFKFLRRTVEGGLNLLFKVNERVRMEQLLNLLK